MNPNSIDRRTITPELLAEIRRAPEVSLDTETTGLAYDDRLLGIGVAWLDEGGVLESLYLNTGHAPSLFFPRHNDAETRALVGATLDRPEGSRIYMHAAPFDIEKLKRWGLLNGGLDPTCLVDTQTTARLAVPFNRKEGTALAHLCDRLLDPGFPEWARALKKQRSKLASMPAEKVEAYGRADAESTLRLGQFLMSEMHKQYGESKAEELLVREARFLLLLTRIQAHGLTLNREFLAAKRKEYTEAMRGLGQSLRDLGIEDPGSRNQLVAHFGTENLPVTEKGNPCVNVDALATLSDPAAKLILEWRSYQKALGTWVDGFESKASGSTGRIHPRFHAAGTISGRLSCTEPNAQAIPMSDGRGHTFGSMQGMFGAPDGYELWAADYAQAELRLASCYAASDRMAEIFASGEDLHRSMASLIWPDREITKELRQTGKTATYTTTYGGGSKALAEACGIEAEDAKRIIGLRRKAFPRLAKMQMLAGLRWKERGYMVALSDRKRFMGDNERDREYAAYNQLIQLGIAETLKDAMLVVDELLTQEEAGCIALQVHDSLEVYLKAERAEEMRPRIATCMVEALPGWLSERTSPAIVMAVDWERWA